MRNKYYIIGLLLLGLIIRLVAFQSGFMFENDVNLFQWWGQMAHTHGLNQVYADGVISFIDYPPGYIYVLYVLGALAARFGWERLDTIFNFFTFLPAILADLGIGYIIYRKVAYGRLTKDRSDKTPKESRPKDLPIELTIRALVVSALWILNPAIILISAVWGQVESVFVIFLLISLLLLREKKLISSYLFFGIAILIKAQSLFLAPVYLYSAFAYLLDNKIQSNHKHILPPRLLSWLGLYGYKIPGKALGRLGIAVGASVLLMVVLVLPFTQGFNIMPIIRLYTGGLGTYPFASVNAFNFWGLLGLNWVSMSNTFFGIPYSIWGVVIVVLLIIGSLYVLHRDYMRYEGRHFFFIVGTLFALIFIFSVRMHERYLFPALTFFLLYYAETRKSHSLGIYAVFSVTFFFNCREILRWLRDITEHGWRLDAIEASTPIISFANVALGGILVYMFAKSKWMEAPALAAMPTERQQASGATWSDSTAHAVADKPIQQKQVPVSDAKRRSDPYVAPTPLAPSEMASEPPPMKRKDWAFFFILIAVYSFIAFFRLGDFRSPQTAWIPEEGEVVTFDLGESHHIGEIQHLMGVGAPHAPTDFTLLSSQDGVQWHHVQTLTPNFISVFKWESTFFHFTARYLQIRADSPHMRVQEVAFRDIGGELIPIVEVSPNGAALVDEQHLVPRYRTFMNSTYFDEVYHPRTAYEFLHGLPVYENTHPPMGKNFIAMSVAVFGMTPFGWRFPGTLAGVLMIPLLYALGRLLFKSNNWGLFAATIFAFSFMTFAQTRIATIDSYVTLFIIAMYYFMYRFIHGLERDSFKKKLVILALCGASVGLAAASKWQGIYAIVGLPVVFFPALYRLYLRDRREATLIFRACFGLFIGLPLLIYILSYIPFVASSGGGGLGTIWSNQLGMYHYHANLDETHGFSSIWWEWPLNLRPIWFYAGRYADGVRGSIASFGNPALFWTGTVATLYMIFYFFTQFTPGEFIEFLQTSRTKRRRSGRSLAIVTKGFDRDIAFLLVAFGAQYLPWVIAPRSLTWIYHFFPSVPFFALIVTWMFKHAIDRRPTWRPWAIGYAVLVVALFALFYPVLSGLPTATDFVQRYLQWLPRWHF